MENYRLWYVRRGEQVQGPFPEALICRYIVLGRIGDEDGLSLDGLDWHRMHELPALIEATHALLEVTDGGVSADDVVWQEERARAALRWLDDRKSPDPRGKGDGAEIDSEQNRRASGERRLTPETLEHHVYRENRALFEAWNRMRHQRYGWAAAFVVLSLLLVLGAALFMQPVRPVTVELHIRQADCTRPAARGVNWSRCNKEGELLVGADLRGAELLGTQLQGARLRYADLTQANLTQADLNNADLTGARLGNTVWTDGRVCAADSVGVCR